VAASQMSGRQAGCLFAEDRTAESQKQGGTSIGAGRLPVCYRTRSRSTSREEGHLTSWRDASVAQQEQAGKGGTSPPAAMQVQHSRSRQAGWGGTIYLLSQCKRVHGRSGQGGGRGRTSSPGKMPARSAGPPLMGASTRRWPSVFCSGKAIQNSLCYWWQGCKAAQQGGP